MNLKYGQTRATTRVESGAIDQGLRSYMLKIYNYMASGVLVTGFVALFLFKYSVVTNEAGSITGLTSLGDAKQVEKDGRTQEADKGRGTSIGG